MSDGGAGCTRGVQRPELRRCPISAIMSLVIWEQAIGARMAAMIAAAALAATAARATVCRAGMPVPVTRAGPAPASVTGRGFRNKFTARTGR